ncbi:MAG: competence/damage-inducible protein A, partial [Limisphaerales bacterium]
MNLNGGTNFIVQIEIINTGSELMLGRVLNTHQTWLCSQFARLGYLVSRQVTVADGGTAIQETVREALSRADLIITTGGLGPTSDDRTRILIAELLGKKLLRDDEILARIENFFAQRQRRLPESTTVQAMVPEGAIVLQNENGTAPGLAMELNPNPFRAGKKTWLILLPGPPRELHPMFTEQVVPLLQKEFGHGRNFVCKTFKTTGLGESFVEEKIAGALKHLTD